MNLENNIQHIFLVEAIHTSMVILNKGHFRPNNDKTPYELSYGRPVTVKHSRAFGSDCYIKRNYGKHRNFDERADEGNFLGYSQTSKGIDATIKIQGE